MPDEQIERGKKILRAAKEDLEILVEQVNVFKRKYGPAAVVFGCTLIEGQGTKYVFGGPAGARMRMGRILARLAEDEEIDTLRGSSPIVPASRLPGVS